jgi:autotransporter-associated beta strand protein
VNTFAKVIADNTGATSVIKSGTNTWALTAANTYTGGTTVNGGTLLLSAGSLSTGAINVATGGSVAITASTYNAGSTSAGPGASLVLNAGSTFDMSSSSINTFNLQQTAGAGTFLTIGGATGTPVNMSFDINSGGVTQIDKIVVNRGIQINGTGPNNGGAEITINPIAASALTAGTYTLIQGASLAGGVLTGPTANLALSANGLIVGSNAYTMSLAISGGNLNMVLAAATANNWYWRGDTGSIWTGTGGTNWRSDAAGTGAQGTPDVVDTAIFAASNATTPLNVTVNGIVQVAGLQFLGTSPTSTHAVTINGSTADYIKLNASGVFVATGSAAHAINAPVQLLANQTWINNSANALTVSGVVSDVGTGVNLTKAGAGRILLSNTANTYRGITTLSGGVLEVKKLTDGGLSSSIGSSGSAATSLVINGGTLDYSGSGDSTNRSFTLGTAGATIQNSGVGGALNLTGVQAIGLAVPTVSGPRTLTLRGANTADNTFSLIIGDYDASNLTNLTKSDSGTWVLAPANGVIGAIGDTNGTNTINNTNTAGLSVGQLVTGEGIPDNTVITSVGATSFTLSNAAQSTSTISYNVGAGSNYTGVTTINGGVLSTNHIRNGGVASGIGASSSLAANWVIDNGTFRYTGAGATTDRVFTLGSTVAGSIGTLDASGTGALIFTSPSALAYGTSNQTRGLVLTGTSASSLVNTLSHVIADNGTSATSLTKSGSNTWQVTGTNTYTGVTTFNGGMLQVTSLANGGVASNIGQSSNAASNWIFNGGGLGYLGATQRIDRLFTVNAGGGRIDSSGSGVLLMGNTGSLVTSGSPVLSLGGTQTGPNRLASSFGGNGSFVKEGPGSWVLAPGTIAAFGNTSTTVTPNQITGINTTGLGLAVGQAVSGPGIAAGTLISSFTATTVTLTQNATSTSAGSILSFAPIASTSATSGNTTIDGTTVSNVNTSGLTAGEYWVYGPNFTPGTLATVSGIGANQTITLNQAAIATGTATALRLVAPSNFVNGYSGTTIVNGGNLQVGVNGLGTTGTGGTTVNTGAILSGTGITNGTANVTSHIFNSGSTLMPGDSLGADIGRLSFNGNLVLNDGVSLVLQLSRSTLYNPTNNVNGIDSGILTALLAGSYESSYRDQKVTETGALSWNGRGALAGAHDSIAVNGTLLLNQATINVVDAGFVANAQNGQVFDLGDWTALDGNSTFYEGENYRAGGDGGGTLILPTLGGGLVYDVSQFSTHGILTIITLPSDIPVLVNSWNLNGGGSWTLANNWRSAVTPNSVGGIVNFTSNITSGSSVALNGNKVAGKVILGDWDNNQRFMFVAGTPADSKLLMNNGNYGAALISKVLSNNGTAAADVIAVPVELRSNLNINNGAGGAGSRLDIAGAISQNAGGLGVSIMGGGRVTFSGTAANSYTGTTTVFSRGFGDAGNPQLVLAKTATTLNATVPGAVESANVTTTANNATVTLTSGNTNNFYVGMPVTGNPNIPNGSTVASIISATQFTLNSGTGVTAGTSIGTTFDVRRTATVASTTGLYVGMPVSGTNIAPGSTISEIKSATQFVLSQNVGGAVASAILGADVLNGAVIGDLTIGNVSRGGIGSSVVHLGGAEQIADNSIIRFDAGAGGNSGANNGNNAYFKLMGFNETVGGISDFTSSGVIENMESETINTNAVLTLNTSGTWSFNGFMRNRAGGSGTGTLGLTVGGTGTQILNGANISYNGPTTINSGATLVLENISNNNSNTNFNGFNSTVANNGTLILRVSGGIAWNYVRDITGTGAVVRDGGAGTLNMGFQRGNASFSTSSTTVTVSSTSELVQGMRVSGNGIPNGATIQQILSNTTFQLSATPLSNSGTNGNTLGYGFANFNGGFSILEGGTTVFNVATTIGNGLSIKGTKNATNVTFNATAPLTVTSGGLTVQGRGASLFGGVLLDINSASSISGPVNIVGGRVRVQGGGTLGSPSSVNVSGSGGFRTTFAGGAAFPGQGLTLFNSDTNPGGDRLGDVSINLNGGNIGLFYSGNSTQIFTESLGALNLLGGSNMIETTGTFGTASTRLTFASISRAKGATVRFTDNNVGGSGSGIILTNSAGLLSGSWAIVGNEFAKYSGTSVTAMVAGDYSINPAAASWNGQGHVKMTANPSSAINNATISSLNIQSGSALTLTVNAGQTLTLTNGGILSNGGTQTIAGAAGILTAGAGSSYDLIAHVNSDLSINAIIANNGANVVSLVKAGTSTLTLGGINTFTGRTYLNEGTLQISSEENLGANPASATADQLFFNGGTLRTTANVTLDDSNRGISIGDSDGIIMVADNTTFTIGAANTIQSTVGRLVYSGASVRGTLTINSNNSLLGGFETLGGQESAGTVNFNGDNTFGYFRMLGSTVNLTGNNTFNDDIFVSEGVLNVGGDNSFNGRLTMEEGTVRLQSDTALSSTNGFQLVMLGGVFDLNDRSTTVSGLTGSSRIINNGAAVGTLVVNASGNTTFGGNLQNGTGVLGLTKTGTGVLSLTSTFSSYSGVTTISGGTIAVQELDIGGNESSLGAASNAAANLVLNGGVLRFNGSFATFTDRSFTLGTGSNAGAFIADGSATSATMQLGFEGLSPSIAFVGTGARSLTLGGSNRGDNIFNLVLGDADSSSPTSVLKTGNGTWLMSRDNSYSGETTVLAGILAVTANGALGKEGGAGVIIGGGTNGAASLGGNNATLDLRNVNYSRLEQMYLAGGTLAATTGTSTWAGSTFVTANSNILVGEGAVLKLTTATGAVFGGAAPITQLGTGTLELSGQADVTTRNTQSTAQHTVQAGTLKLIYTSNNNSKLSDTATLTLGGSRLGGNLILEGGTHEEVVSNTVLNAGNNTITGTLGASRLRMNAISRQAGATVQFSGDNIASTDTLNTNGILGAWATVGGNSWAINSGSTTVAGATISGSGVADGMIRSLAAYTSSGSLVTPLTPTTNDWVNNANMDIVGYSTQTTRTTNTLRFNNTGNPLNLSEYVVNLTGTNTIQTGGILFTNNMGSRSALITGNGTLVSGAGANQDLVILQNNTGSGILEISAVIANGAGTNGVDKSGPGNLILSGLNTYTGVTSLNDGILTIDQLAVGGITAGSNANLMTGVTTSGSNTVVVTSTAGLTVGQSVSGANISGGSTITAITSPTTFTISSTVGAGTTNTLTFGSSVLAAGSTFSANTSTGSAVVSVTTPASYRVGQLVTGSGIAPGTTITAISLPANTITLSSPALTTGTQTLSFAGPASNLGAAANLAGNIVFNGGVLQYNGLSGITDRGFTLNVDAIWNVGNAYTNLVVGGNFSTPTAQDNYTLQKTGAGLLELRGIATINSGSYGIEELRVDDGTLRLLATLSNQFARSDVGSLTLSGGTLELVQGSAALSTTQNLPGRLVVNAGASTIRVVSIDAQVNTPTTTTLALHDRLSPEQVLFNKGSTVLFSEQSVFGAGIANITLAGLFGTDVQVVMPRAVYQTAIDVRYPGVNYFGFVDFNGVAYNVIASDNISIGGAAAHTIQSNPADWFASMNVMDGALAIDAFSGITGPDAKVNTIRFFNSGSASIEGDLSDGSNWVTNVSSLAGLNLGQAVQGEGIAPGAFIIEIDTVNNAVRLSAPVDIVNPTVTDATLFVDPLLNKTGNLTDLSQVVSNINVSGLVVGQGVRGNGIATGTTITAIDASSGSITLSQAVTTTAVGSQLLIDDLARSTVTIGSLLTVVGGAILQTTHAGKHVNSIVGGTLTSGLLNTDGSSADLIIHNWNPLQPFTISSVIANNSAASRVVNFVQTGDGTTVLSGSNTYTGTTYVHGGVLRLDSVGALPTASNLRLAGGVLGLNAGHFNRGLGTGANQVQWAGSGGFAAYGAHRTVDVGSGAQLVWGANGFVPDNNSLLLGASNSDKIITFANSIDLGSKARMVQVASGIKQNTYSDSDAVLSGVLKGSGGSFIKAGYGNLELTGVNTYTGGTFLAEGVLMGTQGSVFASASSNVAVSSSFGTGRIEVGTTTDTRSPGTALLLDFGSGTGTQTLANDVTFGRGNHQGISGFSFANNTKLTGVITSDRQPGTNVFMATAPGVKVTLTSWTGTNGDVIGTGGRLAGSGGFTLIGEGAGGTLALMEANTMGQGIAIRNGKVEVLHVNALGSQAVQLGDATFSLGSADFVTAGTTLLGVERTIGFASDGRSALGGAFVSDGDGTFTAVGGYNTGSGGFYNISSLVGGYQFLSTDVNKTILVKDEVMNPERNGLYVIRQINPDGTMNLGRATAFDSASEMRYGSQITVGGAAYFMASPSISVVNQAGSDPVHWVRDKINPNVTLQVGNDVTSIANPIHVVANGTGTTTIEPNGSIAVQFTGNVTLSDSNAGVQETKNLTLVGPTGATGNGMWFSGIIAEQDGGVGATKDRLKLIIEGSANSWVTLSNANTYSGGTDVTSGTLRVNHATASATGTGDVYVAYSGTFGATDGGRAQISGQLMVDGTLSGNGTIVSDANKNILIGNGGQITVGAAASGPAQTMNINMNGGLLTLNGMLNLDIFSRPSTQPVESLRADQLKLGGSGSVSLANFAELKIATTIANTFQAGDSWKLLDWGTLTKIDNNLGMPGTQFYFMGLDPTSYSAGYVTGDDWILPTLGSGLYWDINNLYTTGVIAIAVPEPGRLCLFMLGLLVLLGRRRRRVG